MILPRRLQIEFSQAIQHVTEDIGTEISPGAMWTFSNASISLTQVASN